SWTVSHASKTLRTQLRPGQRKRFFAVCMEMVLPPRKRPPARQSSIAALIEFQSKPEWVQKRLSSLAIAAGTTDGGIRRSEVQLFRSPSPSNNRLIISGVTGGGTYREASRMVGGPSKSTSNAAKTTLRHRWRSGGSFSEARADGRLLPPDEGGARSRR